MTSRPRLKNNPNDGLFCAYAYPVPYPGGYPVTDLGNEVLDDALHRVHVFGGAHDLLDGHLRDAMSAPGMM